MNAYQHRDAVRLVAWAAILFFDMVGVRVWCRFRDLSRWSYVCIAGLALSAASMVAAATSTYALQGNVSYARYEFLVPAADALQATGVALFISGTALALASVRKRVLLLKLAQPQACLPPAARTASPASQNNLPLEIGRGTPS